MHSVVHLNLSYNCTFQKVNDQVNFLVKQSLDLEKSLLKKSS